MFRLFCKFCLRIAGWNTAVYFPRQIKKCVIVVGPHTSAWDIVIGVCYRSVAGLSGARFLGKQELFEGPFGFLFKWMGGTPVNRAGNQNLVEQVIDLFNNNKECRLALSPEGTRQKVQRLRTGFYHIALGAKVPVVMAGMDYKSKNLLFSDPYYPGNDEAEELQKVIHFFASVVGKNPELGMDHLQE